MQIFVKRCNKCNIEKELSNFYKRKDYKDGFANTCKECCINNSKKNYNENLDRIKKQRKKYRKENPEKHKNRMKIYYKNRMKTHKEYEREKRKQWQQKNKCRHGREPRACTQDECGLKPSSKKCIVCYSKTVAIKKNNPESRLCSSCRKSYSLQLNNTKKFEKEVEQWLDDANLFWSYSNKKLPCSVTTRYPDYMFVSELHTVLLEIDENEHKRYNPECEIARISEFMDSIDYKNLHVIRFNPHSNIQDKKNILISSIIQALNTNYGKLNDTGCVVQYIGYSDNRIKMLDELTCQLTQ